MTSEARRAFVWFWLPGQTEPVVAGQLVVDGDRVLFGYGRTYLAREDRIAIYDPELPLGQGLIAPPAGDCPGCIADAGPDSWGQRVILNARYGDTAAAASRDLGLVDYLLASASNRVGALDFQPSANTYIARSKGEATLDELARASEIVDARLPLTPELAEALLRGSSIGGARPKATLIDGQRQLIAKFSSTSDPFPVVQAEFAAMRLAALSGLDVAPVDTIESLGKRVLLVERFDRPTDGTRRAQVSALTVLGLAEHEGRYASYADLAETIRHRFRDSERDLRELFGRIVFSILISNTDDHARNTAAFWDGRWLDLTPAYDLCPQRRGGEEAQQVMAIGSDGWRYSQLAGCVDRAGTYLLKPSEAREIIDHQIDTVVSGWSDVCDEAHLSRVERDSLWGTQICNPYAFYDYGRSSPQPGRR